MPRVSKEWEIPARLTVSQNSTILNHKTIYQLQFMTNSRKKTKNTCNSYDRTSVQSETDSSKTTTLITLQIHLLATHKLQSHQCMHKTLKFLD